jgi:hypothetical protein
MSGQTNLTARGHHHVEAFCLMQYQCKVCRHSETIWNSRDGVTPFGCECPSCGSMDMIHVNFGGDQYAPNHTPHVGQRVWISMSKDRAQSIARRNVLVRKKPSAETDHLIDEVAAQYYRDGTAPDIRIEGFSRASEVEQALALRDARIAALERRIKFDAEIMHDLLVGNQAAWIEWKRGAGAEAAMTWVQGSLMGVGVPDESAPWAMEAQAWYSASKADPFPTCFCGRPSNTAWMGQGFCSDAHYDQGRAKADADAVGKTGLPLFDGTSPDTKGGSCD